MANIILILQILQEGSTALHLGARDGNEDIVDSLLDHKADVTLLSKVCIADLSIFYTQVSEHLS